MKMIHEDLQETADVVPIDMHFIQLESYIAVDIWVPGPGFLRNT